MPSELEAAADLQDRIDRAAFEMLQDGRLAVAVVCHPETPGAALIIGYAVVLDPSCEPDRLLLR